MLSLLSVCLSVSGHYHNDSKMDWNLVAKYTRENPRWISQNDGLLIKFQFKMTEWLWIYKQILNIIRWKKKKTWMNDGGNFQSKMIENMAGDSFILYLTIWFNISESPARNHLSIGQRQVGRTAGEGVQRESSRWAAASPSPSSRRAAGKNFEFQVKTKKEEKKIIARPKSREPEQHPSWWKIQSWPKATQRDLHKCFAGITHKSGGLLLARP